MNDVICPKCNSRFVARENGELTLAQCGCGHVFHIPRREDFTAPVAHCAACAAPIGENAFACRHCGAPVKREQMRREASSQICPACRRFNPRNARFCGLCGVPMTPEAIREVPQSRTCPRCEGELHVRDIADFSGIECRGCRGLWVAAHEFRRIAARMEERHRRFGAPQPLGQTPPPRHREHIRCLYCSRLMTMREFSPRSRIYIDFCKNHGIWFDHEEFRLAVRFIERFPNAVHPWAVRRSSLPIEQRYLGAQRAAAYERELSENHAILRLLDIIARGL